MGADGGVALQLALELADLPRPGEEDQDGGRPGLRFRVALHDVHDEALDQLVVDLGLVHERQRLLRLPAVAPGPRPHGLERVRPRRRPLARAAVPALVLLPVVGLAGPLGVLGAPADAVAGGLEHVLQVALLDGVREPGDADDVRQGEGPLDVRGAHVAREVVGEEAGVGRGAHEHDAERGRALEQLGEQQQQQVRVERPLVDLVHHHVRDAPQGRVPDQPPEQDPRRAEQQPRLGRLLALQPDRVPHALPDLLPALRRHPARQPHRRDPPRLRADDVALAAPAALDLLLQDVLRHLRALPAPRRPADDHHLVPGHRRQHLRPLGGRGERPPLLLELA